MNRIESLIKILQQEPNDVFTNYALAIEFVAEGNYTMAEQQFLKVLSIDKKYLPCYYQLGQLKEKTNEIPAALAFYKQGLELAKEQGNNKAINEINEAIWMLED